MQETWVLEDPLEKGIATHSRTLGSRIPWTERSLAGYSPWGHKELDMIEWPTLMFLLFLVILFHKLLIVDRIILVTLSLTRLWNPWAETKSFMNPNGMSQIEPRSWSQVNLAVARDWCWISGLNLGHRLSPDPVHSLSLDIGHKWSPNLCLSLRVWSRPYSEP